MAAETEPQAEHEHVQAFDLVEAWRFNMLTDSGYDFLTAVAIAVSPDIDLHQACELVEHGCSPDLAREILL